MMESSAFTDAKIRGLKPLPAQYELADGGQRGLRIRVSPGGVKAWNLVTRIKSVKRRIKIGTYPELSLTSAREEARRQLARIQLGSDIWTERKGWSNHLRFEEFAEKYLADHASQKADGGHEDRRKVQKHLLPHWAKLRADEISKRHVHVVIDEAMKGDAHTMPNRILQLIKTMFSWGIEKDLVQSNPAEHIRKPRREVPRDRYLNELEIKQLWKTLDTLPLLYCDFFKLCILMGQRIGSEMRCLRWSEIDIERRLMTISAGRMKNRMTHEVPISQFALSILLDLKNRAGVSPLVFPSPINPLAEPMAYPKKRFAKLRELSGIEKDFHAHDFRHTISTLMTSRLKVQKIVVEKIISHKSVKGLGEVYDQHDYLDEKREALERWGMFVRNIINEQSDLKL